MWEHTHWAASLCHAGDHWSLRAWESLETHRRHPAKPSMMLRMWHARWRLNRLLMERRGTGDRMMILLDRLLVSRLLHDRLWLY